MTERANDMTINKNDRDRYTDITEEAMAHLDGAIDGFLGGLRVTRENEPAEAIFFAIESALVLHAARIAAFRKKKFGSDITAKSFAEMATEHFNFMHEEFGR
jgi:hypothetical protein